MHAHATRLGAKLRWAWYPDPSPEIVEEFERLAAKAEEETLRLFEDEFGHL
jgi:hypothetical protein